MTIEQEYFEAKKKLDAAKALVLKLEVDLYKTHQNEIGDKIGTNKWSNSGYNVTIVTKQNVSYDQKELWAIDKTYALPFKKEFKVLKAELVALSEINPGSYQAVLETRTIKPAKPSFKVEVAE